MANVSVKLVEPIEGHDGPISEIILRRPKFSDVMTLGEPAAYARSEEGLVFQAERDGVVQAYINRLLVEPKDPAILLQLGLADSLKLKEVVYDFFQDARKAISADVSTTS